MKIAIVSSHAGGDIEPTVAANLLSHLPNQVANVNEADVIVVPVSFQPNYKFSERLREVEGKKWVLMCFMEYGWDARTKNNLWGTGMTHQFGHLNTPDYAKFDQWVAAHPPVLTLKRELMARDLKVDVVPVVFPCRQTAFPIHTKEQFNERPLECLFCWGLSHPTRPRLHGDIWKNAHDYGINVLDSFADEGHFEKRNWASIYAPHWRRKHINEVFRWNRRSKLSVSLHGAGKVCFRTTMESPVGSILALPFDDLVWPFEWLHGDNCIRLNPELLFFDLERATHRDDLYDIYLACQETVDRYRSERFVEEYISPKIEECLL